MGGSTNGSIHRNDNTLILVCFFVWRRRNFDYCARNYAIFKKKKKEQKPPASDINFNINIHEKSHEIESSSDIPYNLNAEKDNQVAENSYEKYPFSSDEFYVGLLSQVEEKKKGKDKIYYE